MNLSMLSQDKDTRVVRVPVGYRLMLTGSRMATAERILRIMGSSFPAPASTGVALRWRCNMVTNTTAYRPTIAESERATNSSRRFLGGQRCALGAGGVQVVRAGSFSRSHHRCSVGGVVDREPHCAVVVGVPGEAGEAYEDRGNS